MSDEETSETETEQTEQTETETTETSTETTETEKTETEKTESESTEKTEKTEKSDAERISDHLDLSGKSTEKTEKSEKSEETTAGEGDNDEERESKPLTGAPDSYTTFEMPAEAKWWTDKDADAVGSLAKQLDLSQEGAQLLAAAFNEHGAARLIPAIEAKQAEEYAAHCKAELTKAKMNPILVGPKGDLWDATKNYVKEVVINFGGNGTIGEGRFERLKAKGFFDDEDMLCLMKEVGTALMPDTLDPAGDPGSGTEEDQDPSRQMGWNEDAVPATST